MSLLEIKLKKVIEWRDPETKARKSPHDATDKESSNIVDERLLFVVRRPTRG